LAISSPLQNGSDRRRPPCGGQGPHPLGGRLSLNGYRSDSPGVRTHWRRFLMGASGAMTCSRLRKKGCRWGASLPADIA
jgi:hypothetical protein